MDKLDSMIKEAKKRLPITDHESETTTKIRWVRPLSDNYNTEKELIKTFLQQNFITHTKFSTNRGRYNQMVLENFSREEKMNNIMKNPWLAFEYFLVDQLNRWKYKYRWINMEHKKWSPYLDHKRKIDYTSSIQQQKNKQNINIGIQLTTQQSWGKIFPDQHKREMKQKRKIVKKLSQKAYENKQIRSFEGQTVDLTWYMIVNGHINQTINIARENVFAIAFEKRKKEWLPWTWPIKHLPKNIRKDMWTIRLTYHLSLLDFTKYINKAKQNKELQKRKTEELYTHKKDAYIIRRNYDPDKQELTHHIFIEHKNDPEKAILLFSMSYFLHNNIRKTD